MRSCMLASAVSHSISRARRRADVSELGRRLRRHRARRTRADRDRRAAAGQSGRRSDAGSRKRYRAAGCGALRPSGADRPSGPVAAVAGRPCHLRGERSLCCRGTALALFQRETHGRGQLVRVSVRQALESLLEQAMTDYTFAGKPTERRGARGAITAVSGALRCKDGYWMLSLLHSGDGWNRMMNWMRDPELARDHELADEAKRHERPDYILDRIRGLVARYQPGADHPGGPATPHPGFSRLYAVRPRSGRATSRARIFAAR